jgi:hypothetical protein
MPSNEALREAEAHLVFEESSTEIDEGAKIRLAALLTRTADAARDEALEYAAQIADAHWPESGHVHQSDAVSCQMSISVEIRRAKGTKEWQPTEHEKKVADAARLEAIEAAVWHEPTIHLDESGNVPHAWITCRCGWDGRNKLPWSDAWRDHIRVALEAKVKEGGAALRAQEPAAQPRTGPTRGAVMNFDEELEYIKQREARPRAEQPAPQHIFDRESTLQDCSCGWKADDKTRQTLEGAEASWREHAKRFVPALPAPSAAAAGPECGCDEYPECTHMLYWQMGLKVGLRTAPQGSEQALLDIIRRVWKHAETDGTLPVLLLQDIEAALRARGK